MMYSAAEARQARAADLAMVRDFRAICHRGEKQDVGPEDLWPPAYPGTDPFSAAWT